MRQHFPQLDGAPPYLASHTLAPMPRQAEEALQAYADLWKTRGVRAWGDSWWELPRHTATSLAPLLGVSAEGISFHPHATAAVAAVLSGIDFSRERRKIVATELEFPSILYQLKAWEKFGAQVEVLPAPDGRFPWEAVDKAVDNTTALVAVCHAYFKSSERIDVAQLARTAHAQGARLLVDSYQTAGVMPLAFEAEGADYVVGGGVKWLLSGPGTGYLWVRPGLLHEAPHLVGWSGHARPFAFELDWSPAEGGLRFHTGTGNIPAMVVAKAGYDLLQQVGLPAIWARIQQLAEHLMQGAEDQGLRVVGPRQAAQRSGTVILDLPYGYAAVLNQRSIVCDWRTGAGVRLGLHAFLLEDELDRALEEIAQITHSRAWEAWQPGLVT